jgi:hypothetical protein
LGIWGSNAFAMFYSHALHDLAFIHVYENLYLILQYLSQLALYGSAVHVHVAIPYPIPRRSIMYVLITCHLTKVVE